jgi:uncharacterized protein (TIGR02466 family)
MDYNSILGDRIFYSTLWSFRPTCAISEVKKNLEKVKKAHPKGNKISNYGGWQSPCMSFADIEQYPAFKSLCDELTEFIEVMSENDGSPVVVNNIDFWANENKKHDYNKTHSHATADYIAVYYPKYPEGSGSLDILRTDAGRLLTQNWGHPYNSEISLEAEEGRMYVLSGHLMHFVHPHTSDEVRQSLAFNIHVKLPPQI